MIFGIIFGIISAGLIVAGFIYLKKQVASSVGSETNALVSQFPALTSEIQDLLGRSTNFVPKSHVDSVQKQIEDTQVELDKQKQALKELETKLNDSQKLVEQKEAQHQEIKSSKEEDELKVKEIMERYDSISSESMALEQRIASSMKTLDTLMSELTLTADQKAMLDDLSNSLTSAGSRLRDLLTEYGTVHERLEMLTQQHQDLEAEYTRLVEQQLGE